MQFLPKEKSSSRGLIVKVNKIELQSHINPFGNIQVRLSNHWSTIKQLRDDEHNLYLIVVGHLYTRDSYSFNVDNALSSIGQIYRENDIDTVYSEIAGGMFALFIVDFAKQQLHALCDFLACMPLFFQKTKKSITLVTNQIDLHHSSQLSTDACLEYINFGYLPFSSSLFRDVNRLGPGQILTIDAKACEITRLSKERIPAYPPPSERIKNTHIACLKLDAALTRFFSKLHDSDSISSGLSGGYDSRLIAAFTRQQKPYFVTFNYPGTRELDTAQKIALSLGNKTQICEIPPDAPSRYVKDFLYGMQTLDNLGSSHVFALLDVLLQNNPSYIIDGFLGDVIMGGGYFYKLTGGVESLFHVLTLKDNYKMSIHPLDDYVGFCLAGKGRSIDLEFITGKNQSDFINLEKLKSQLSQQLNSCYSHADMIEMLTYRFRGRCLIACGPITFLRHTSTLCPFYDKDVFTICTSIDKKVRAGERLYNAFWRHRFPELAHIPKESTGGRATQSDICYRLTHFTNALLKHLSNPISGFVPHYKSGGDLDNFLTQYCKNPSNMQYFNNLNSKLFPYLREIGLDNFHLKLEFSSRKKELFLRFLSLLSLLNQTI